MKIGSCSLVVLCLALLPVPPAFPGEAVALLAAEKRGVVEIRVFRDESPRSAGRVGLIVRLRMTGSWHINSHKPLDEFLIPTTVKLGDNPYWKLDGVSYPEGKKIGLSFSTEPVSVYEGTVDIPVVLEPKEGAVPRSTVKLLVGFQPCNANSCVAPETVELTVEIRSEAEEGG